MISVSCLKYCIAMLKYSLSEYYFEDPLHIKKLALMEVKLYRYATHLSLEAHMNCNVPRFCTYMLVTVKLVLFVTVNNSIVIGSSAKRDCAGWR